MQKFAALILLSLLPGCAGAGAVMEGASAFANGYARGATGLPYQPAATALPNNVTCVDLGSGIISCNDSLGRSATCLNTGGMVSC
jgi:hypothetical protein